MLLELAWCGHRVAQLERKCNSLSALDRRIGSLFFMWDIFNVFLGAMLARSSPSLGLSAARDSCSVPKCVA